MNTPFQITHRVAYVPTHANGDIKHENVEYGNVSSVNGSFVFVKFDKQIKLQGWRGATAKSCDPKDLVSFGSDDSMSYVPIRPNSATYVAMHFLDPKTVEETYPLYKIEQHRSSDVWNDGPFKTEGKTKLFFNVVDAQKELDKFFDDQNQAFKNTDLVDVYHPDDFRIVLAI